MTAPVAEPSPPTPPAASPPPPPAGPPPRRVPVPGGGTLLVPGPPGPSEPAAPRRGPAPAAVLTADGAYAARLTHTGGSWYPERWTLDSPEPYAVPLPGHQPEEPGTAVHPMADGRVLVHRRAAGRHVFALLYPTGPGTGEVALGGVECAGAELTLLPPAPDGTYAYALAAGERSTAVWLVAGGSFGPEHLAEVPGRCTGGVWLDGTNRMLALDRELDGLTKTVAVDLERGGEVTPLLQIAADSDDRLLLADAASGLLLLRSDAPGEPRLGWGVLGSTHPVRFPECLRLPGSGATPFAIQPGQVLTPEACAVALRLDAADPASRPALCAWRPADRRVHRLTTPDGWLPGVGHWTPEGVLRLPYAGGAAPCGVARVEVPGAPAGRPAEAAGAPPRTAAAGACPRGSDGPGGRGGAPRATRPVPLQQAPLGGRAAGG
ncbi:hypothetical protein C9F11_12930 [Streptomyces sp. YIM 121038]|uniref:hypothetical protein n=1 Tax=Streptomyces sp. YIM 121038 TaxID=2136401 RepID=UPI0011640F26|nr:hypothetical protein [Streptomyces sp. YIM 121038]QCX76263.1 hypothetical protein C9F11_12930 [Streptomyces sp. YIM 121038]